MLIRAVMTDSKAKPLSYADAGVDIEAGERLVGAIGPLAKATARAGVMGGLGGFGALFDLKSAGFADPVLVSGTDGVGTKLMLAFETGIHTTVGIDLVAMCANDVLAQGAEPLFFLDYFATGALDEGVAEAVVSGIAEAANRPGAPSLAEKQPKCPACIRRVIMILQDLSSAQSSAPPCYQTIKTCRWATYLSGLPLLARIRMGIRSFEKLWSALGSPLQMLPHLPTSHWAKRCLSRRGFIHQRRSRSSAPG